MYVLLVTVFLNGHVIAQTHGPVYATFQACRTVGFTAEPGPLTGEVIVTSCEKVK